MLTERVRAPELQRVQRRLVPYLVWTLRLPLAVLGVCLFGLVENLAAAVLIVAAAYPVWHWRVELERAAWSEGAWIWRRLWWPRIARRCGLVAEHRIVELRRVRVDGPVELLELRLVAGVALEDVEKAQPRLRESLRAYRLTVESPAPGRVVLRSLRRDVLTGAPVPLELADPAPAGAAVWLGLDATGRRVALPLDRGAVLVAGLPGAGKSTALTGLVAQLTARDDCWVLVVDPKRVDYVAFRDAGVAVEVDHDRIAASLDAVASIMQARYRRLELAGRTSWEPDELEPRIVVVVDELAELLATGHRDNDQAMTVRLRRLVALGRAAGVTVVAATQRPAVDVIPSSLRDLFSLRLCFRTANPTSTALVVGEHADAVPAHRISADTPGRGYLIGASATPVELRAFLAGPELAQRIGRRRRPALNEALATGPAQAPGSAQEPRTEPEGSTAAKPRRGRPKAPRRPRNDNDQVTAA